MCICGLPDFWGDLGLLRLVLVYIWAVYLPYLLVFAACDSQVLGLAFVLTYIFVFPVGVV